MERRDVLKYTALLAGATVSGPLLSVILSGCNTGPADTAEPGQLFFFSPEEFALITALTDVILPGTDSPSASDAGVHYTIDRMVGTVYKEEDKAGFRKGFDALSGYLRAASEGKGIMALENAEQLNLLKQLESTEEEKWEAARSAFLGIKQQTIAYYLSSKEVAINYLNYLPVPGAYKPCISLEEAGGKAWAL